MYSSIKYFLVINVINKGIRISFYKCRLIETYNDFEGTLKSFSCTCESLNVVRCHFRDRSGKILLCTAAAPYFKNFADIIVEERFLNYIIVLGNDALH